jgi:TolB-like protein
MKVLVVLSKAEGLVLTRDDLIDCCWEGRIVGEDAIQRVLGRIRHLANDVANNSFRLETVRGVGCRLVAPQFPPDAPQWTSSSPGEDGRGLRRAILGAAVAVGIVAGVGLYLQKESGAEVEPVSVAVLPFKNMSAGTPYFAEGVAEEVANQLARDPQFKVAGRTSSELFKEAADLRDVGRRLHVAYLLEGSVRSAGERVQVEVSLVDARKGMRLWSRSFRGSLNDIFAIQDTIGQQVAAHVHRQLIQMPLPRGTTTTRGDVYSLYLTARGLIGSREPAKLHSAVELLRQAVKLDPGYSPAWAQLALAMRFEWQRSRPNPMQLDAARRQWLRIAQHALRLAPDSTDAHLAMCYILSSFAGETTKYEELDNRHCERAAQLAPNDAEVWDSIAQGREYEGDFPGALEAYRRVYAIEPLWWHGYGSLTIVSWRMGYREEARKVVDQTVRDLKPFSANIVRATLATEEGDWSEALQQLRAARALADPSEKELADTRIATVMRSLGYFEQARARFPNYEVDDDMWRMWNGKAPSPLRVAELGQDPVKLWHTTKMYFLARTLLGERRSAELLRLYDRRFKSPDELHAILHDVSPEILLALRDVGRVAEADRLAKLGEADARRIQSHGRVPFDFYYNRSMMLAAEGKREEAIAALQKAVNLGWFYNSENYSFHDIAQEPAFREIVPDPRFQRVRAYLAAHVARERREAQAAGLQTS